MTDPSRHPALLRWSGRALLLLPWILLVLGGLYAAVRFLPDVAVQYSDPVEHFKYGSTGGERESGFPYWIWQALPQVCAVDCIAHRAGVTRRAVQKYAVQPEIASL